jgi:hypothetical protein
MGPGRTQEMDGSIPDEVRRFVLTSIPTVPHLETLLLLWRERKERWSAEEIALRLYVAPALAHALAADLCSADLLDCEGDPPVYRSRREPSHLARLVEGLDQAYTRQLREVTRLIHSNVDRRAERFKQAFTWKKDR